MTLLLLSLSGSALVSDAYKAHRRLFGVFARTEVSSHGFLCQFDSSKPTPWPTSFRSRRLTCLEALLCSPDVFTAHPMMWRSSL